MDQKNSAGDTTGGSFRLPLKPELVAEETAMEDPNFETSNEQLSLEEKCNNLFKDLELYGQQLRELLGGPTVTAVVDAIEYCVQSGMNTSIVQAVHQLLDVPGSSESAQESSKAVANLFEECQSNSECLRTIIESIADSASWGREDEIVLRSNWEELGLRLGRLVRLLPMDFYLDMNALLGHTSVSHSFDTRPILDDQNSNTQQGDETYGEEQEGLLDEASIRSTSVFSKAAYVDQIRRRTNPPSRQAPHQQPMESESPQDVRLKGGGNGVSPEDSTFHPNEKGSEGPRIRQSEPYAPPPPYNDTDLTRLRARVLWPFNGEAAEELSLVAGEYVEVLDMTDPTWWAGRTERGRYGLFPHIFVELVDEQRSGKENSRAPFPSPRSEIESGTIPPIHFSQGASSNGTITNKVFFSENMTVHVHERPPSAPESIHFNMLWMHMLLLILFGYTLSSLVIIGILK